MKMTSGAQYLSGRKKRTESILCSFLCRLFISHNDFLSISSFRFLFGVLKWYLRLSMDFVLFFFIGLLNCCNMSEKKKNRNKHMFKHGTCVKTKLAFTPLLKKVNDGSSAYFCHYTSVQC